MERLSWLLLVAGVVASGVFGVEWRSTVQAQNTRSADVRAAEVQARLSEQLGNATGLNTDLGALVTTDPSLTNAQLQSWFERAGSASNGVVVQAFIADVPAAQLPAVAARDVASPVFGLPFSTFSLNPPGARSTYCLLTLGALNLPPSMNLQDPAIKSAISAFGGFLSPGTDMCSTDASSDLLGSAVDASTSADPLGVVIALVEGHNRAVGQQAVNELFGRLTPFFEMTPVYRTLPVPTTPSARLADLDGWSVTVVDAEPMLGPVVKGDPGLSVSLSYQNATGAPTPLVRAGTAAGPSVERTVAVGADGHWIAQLSIPIPSALTPNEEGVVVLFGTLLFTLLLFALVRVMAVSRAQALALVEQTAGALEHQARHDALTGLANRSLVIDQLDEALAQARAGQGGALALLVIDLDGFKDVNDAFGHAVGDELLQAVAGRLVEMIGVTTTIGRLGGDEFVVVIDGGPSDDPEQMAKSILSAMSLPIRLTSVPGPVSVGASIGVATGLRASGRDLLRDADIALYEAKSNGKNRYAVFRSEMRTAVVNRFDLETELRTAMRANQFFLVYQPTFDLEGMGVTGVEALLRWHHPTRGIVPPMEFVPVLESSGMIIDVGRWVLAEACRQVRLWHNEGYPVSVAVNVSGRQFEGSNLVQDVRTALVRSGLDPHSLVIEITETVLMRDPTVIADRLRQIKELGVRVAIDDFGTGYSSMAYLQQFPVDILKIDRSFVTGMVESPEGAALVRALVQLGKALGLTTLAEGIEDEIQLYRLRAEKCDAGQGYLFAKPLTASDAERFMAERSGAAGGAAPPDEPPPPVAPVPAPTDGSSAARVPAGRAPASRATSYSARPPGVPANGASVNGAGANGSSVNGAGANGAPVNGAHGSAPVNGAGANGAPVNGAHGSAPVNGAGANGAPVNGAHGNGAPAGGAPAGGAPAGGAPAGGAPAGDVPAGGVGPPGVPPPPTRVRPVAGIPLPGLASPPVLSTGAAADGIAAGGSPSDLAS